MPKYRHPHSRVTLQFIASRTRVSESGCHEWQGARSTAGYGQINVEGRRLYVHRLVFELSFGKPKAQVCHHCDNPGCCNPKHLFSGTAKQNSCDMVSKGRNVCLKGTDTWSAKLDADKVRSIRRLLALRKSHRSIARQFGVSAPQISYIKNGRTWKHVK